MHISQSIGRIGIGALLLASTAAAYAVPVKFTFGNMTPYMNLTEKSTGNAVEVGEGYASYSADLASGDYVWSL